VTLPSYSAISFHSKEEHQAALYDCCLFIVNTYNQTDMLDGHCIENYNGKTASLGDRCGRKYIGCERDEDYFTKLLERIREQNPFGL